jgi:hypothetical protein
MAVYAYICAACNHPAAQHRMVPGPHGERSVDRPYACRWCDCVMERDDPTYTVNQAEYFELYGPSA